MTDKDIIKILGQFKGYKVGTVGLANQDKECWIELLAEDDVGICDSCG